jgi:hypothetical protein
VHLLSSEAERGVDELIHVIVGEGHTPGGGGTLHTTLVKNHIPADHNPVTHEDPVCVLAGQVIAKEDPLLAHCIQLLPLLLGNVDVSR